MMATTSENRLNIRREPNTSSAALHDSSRRCSERIRWPRVSRLRGCAEKMEERSWRDELRFERAEQQRYGGP
jgi:hypothetical protein